jgi:hypothetical protein
LRTSVAAISDAVSVGVDRIIVSCAGVIGVTYAVVIAVVVDVPGAEVTSIRDAVEVTVEIISVSRADVIGVTHGVAIAVVVDVQRADVAAVRDQVTVEIERVVFAGADVFSVDHAVVVHIGVETRARIEVFEAFLKVGDRLDTCVVKGRLDIDRELPHVGRHADL